MTPMQSFKNLIKTIIKPIKKTQQNPYELLLTTIVSYYNPIYLRSQGLGDPVLSMLLGLGSARGPSGCLGGR